MPQCTFFIGMDVATLVIWIWSSKHIYIYVDLQIFTYSYTNISIHSFIHSTNIPNVSYESGSVLDAWNMSVNTPDEYPCPF